MNLTNELKETTTIATATATKPVVYGVVKEEYILGDTRRVSYGIAAYADADEVGTASIVASVRDITSDQAAIVALVDRCNRCALSLIHLRDVVEDALL